MCARRRVGRTARWVHARCGSSPSRRRHGAPGSILIFPKVVNTGGRDTVIQIGNTGNMMDHARCFYVDGRPGPRGVPVCGNVDFDIWLTKQQPTHWRASTGRSISVRDDTVENEGLSPGLVPAVPDGFIGALVCVEVDSSDDPVGMNQLKGEATLEGPGLDMSKYNALAIQGSASGNSGDNRLALNGTEYSLCPADSLVNFIPDGATDPVIEALGNGGRCVGGTNAPCNNGGDCQSESCSTGLSRVISNLTVLPCNLDLLNGIPTSVTLDFAVSDEFEVKTRGSLSFSCWASIPFSSVPALSSPTIATPFATAKITSVSGGPVLAIADSLHIDSAGNAADAAVNLHMEGVDSATTTRILLP